MTLTATFTAHQAANQRRRDQIGQFATEQLDEALATELLDPSKTSHADEAIDELDTLALMAAARASVRTHAYRKGVRFVGEDDMVQETIEAVLKNKANNERVVITRPYVHTVGAGIVAQAARGRLRAEDRKAIGMYTAQVDDLELELDRRLTGAEKDQVAAKIREQWEDTRHRPSVDFVALAQVRVLSLSAPAGDRDGENGHTLLDTVSDHTGHSTAMTPDDDGLSVDPDSPAAKVLSGEQTSQVKNRNEVWEMYASLTGVPAAVPGLLPSRRAMLARTQVAAGGGAAAAARTWQSGETTEATAALFAPFGELDEQGRDDVAGALIQRAPYAEEMFASAVWGATRRAA